MYKLLIILLISFTLGGCDTFHMSRVDFNENMNPTKESLIDSLERFSDKKGWSCVDEFGQNGSEYICGHAWYLRLQLLKDDNRYYFQTMNAHPAWCDGAHNCKFLREIDNHLFHDFGADSYIFTDLDAQCTLNKP